MLRRGLLLLAALFLAGCGPRPPTENLAIRVDLATLGREFSPCLRGVMIGSWEDSSTDAFLAARLREAGVGFLEFPGGLEADGYDWQNPGPGRMSPGRFVSLAEAAGAATRMCIVDYRADDPAKAAGWVEEAKRRGWGITYWEVGDEEYGSWAAGATPAAYAERFRRYYWAMKAADPEARIGAPIPLEDPVWTRAVVNEIGALLDWVALSYYPQDPGGEDDTRLLWAPDELGQKIEALRDLLATAAPGRKIEVIVTGWHTVSWDPGPQSLSPVAGLFAAEAIGAMAAAGVDAAGIFCGRMGLVGRGGSYGLFDNGPDPGPGRPVYWGLRAWAEAEGDLVSVSSSETAVRAWAVAGTERVLLVIVNRDGVRSFSARVEMDGYSTGPGEMVIRRYGKDHSTLAEIGRMAPARAFTLTLPPHSLAVVEVPR
ncbi:MAG: hypothetical protein ACUVRM_05595 [Bacillota bacterium]